MTSSQWTAHMRKEVERSFKTICDQSRCSCLSDPGPEARGDRKSAYQGLAEEAEQTLRYSIRSEITEQAASVAGEAHQRSFLRYRISVFRLTLASSHQLRLKSPTGRYNARSRGWRQGLPLAAICTPGIEERTADREGARAGVEATIAGLTLTTSIYGRTAMEATRNETERNA